MSPAKGKVARIRFAKIKYNGTKTELTWVVKQEDGTATESTCRSHQKPLPGLIAALAAFAPLVGKCLDLTAKYVENDFAVTSVSINTVEKTGTRGFVFSFRKDVSGAKAPFFGNTPHLAEAPEGESGAGYIGANWLAAIELLEDEASRYVAGEREQGELPLESSAKDEEE